MEDDGCVNVVRIKRSDHRMLACPVAIWHLNRGRTSQKLDPRFQRNSPRIKGDELYVKSLSSCTQPVDNLGLWHSTCRLAAQNAALNL